MVTSYNGGMARKPLEESEDTKVTTVRLPASQAAELEAIARVEEIPVSEAIRAAISEHIRTRRGDKAFMERLRRRIEEDREILVKLSQR